MHILHLETTYRIYIAGLHDTNLYRNTQKTKKVQFRNILNILQLFINIVLYHK